MVEQETEHSTGQSTDAPRSAWARLRRRTWQIVEAARPDDPPSRWFDIGIMTLILMNVVVVIVGTVEGVEEHFETSLLVFEIVSVVVFSVEYIARVWACTASQRFGRRGAVRGRLRFMVTPLALIDLFAVLPFYLPLLGIDLRFLRALRLLRILRVAKLGRYLPAFLSLKRVIRNKKEELVLSLSVLVLLLVMAASLMYYAERGAQPEVFSSIPATMWWAVATLTTVGYGDVYPITTLGRVLASFVAVLGIGLFALPASILASGFQEELDRLKEHRRRARNRGDLRLNPEGESQAAPARCPHCGEPLDSSAE